MLKVGDDKLYEFCSENPNLEIPCSWKDEIKFERRKVTCERKDYIVPD